MIEHTLIGKHVRELALALGYFLVPDRPLVGDPEHGLDRYIEFPERGLAIVIDWEDICCCVQLFSSDKMPSYQQYVGGLPEGLGFDSSRSDVRGVLGSPVESREGGGRVFEIQIYPWDWFAYQGLKLHFEYGDTLDCVRMVSVMPLQTST